MPAGTPAADGCLAEVHMGDFEQSRQLICCSGSVCSGSRLPISPTSQPCPYQTLSPTAQYARAAFLYSCSLHPHTKSLSQKRQLTCEDDKVLSAWPGCVPSAAQWALLLNLHPSTAGPSLASAGLSAAFTLSHLACSRISSTWPLLGSRFGFCSSYLIFLCIRSLVMIHTVACCLWERAGLLLPV